MKSFVYVQPEHYRRATKTLHACSDCTSPSVIPNQSSIHISQTLKWWLDAWPGVASAIRISASTRMQWMLSMTFLNVTLHCQWCGIFTIPYMC